MLVLGRFRSFAWDNGNRGKNWKKHGVADAECEQVFFNRPLLVLHDEAHSEEEIRYFVLGRTDQGRRLFVVFTGRGNQIRVISARNMTKRERAFYPL